MRSINSVCKKTLRTVYVKEYIDVKLNVTSTKNLQRLRCHICEQKFEMCLMVVLINLVQ